MISRNDWSGTEKKLPARMISQNDYSEGLDRFFGGKMINHSCGTVLYRVVALYTEVQDRITTAVTTPSPVPLGGSMACGASMPCGAGTS